MSISAVKHFGISARHIGRHSADEAGRWAMRMWPLAAILLCVLVAPAWAIDQAMPGDHPAISGAGHNHGAPAAPPGVLTPPREDRREFRDRLDLAAFRRLAVQHEEQLKIIDSWARQSLVKIANRSRIEGQDPVYTALDMCFRPEYWAQQNIVYVQAAPIRQQLGNMVVAGSDAERMAEQNRIFSQGTVSPAFLMRDDVQQLLEQLAARDVVVSRSINKVQVGLGTFLALNDSLALVPPKEGANPWHVASDLIANVPESRALALQMAGGNADAPQVPGYDAARARKLLDIFGSMAVAWNAGDAMEVNAGLAALAAELPQAQAQSYPPAGKRELELWYTRSFSGTLVGVVYFAAMVLFLLAAAGAAPRARRWAMVLFTLALVCHIGAMGVRWYLAGRIPIQNQFESVLGSALLGCFIGWCLEAWRKNGLFGMAMSFVGFLAMTACLVVPFVVGKSIGENISPVAGILNTFWLYIHVNVVICSYALIAASAGLGIKYLLTELWYWVNPLIEPDAALATVSGGGVGGSAALGAGDAAAEVLRGRRNYLDMLDSANVIVMRLSFLFLGTGIVLGALWADQSWGRPWGWDPKETFALVTWLVYLILVHVRFAAPSSKGAWTAWLSVIGFAIMLFNWIGVNFFLVGLHSYA